MKQKLFTRLKFGMRENIKIRATLKTYCENLKRENIFYLI